LENLPHLIHFLRNLKNLPPAISGYASGCADRFHQPILAPCRIAAASFKTTEIFPLNSLDLPSGYQQYEGDNLSVGSRSIR
jgi:hypothetical protein